MPRDVAGIMGAYSHGLKVDLGNNKEMIFITGQIAQDKNGMLFVKMLRDKQNMYSIVFKIY